MPLERIILMLIKKIFLLRLKIEKNPNFPSNSKYAFN